MSLISSPCSTDKLCRSAVTLVQQIHLLTKLDFHSLNSHSEEQLMRSKILDHALKRQNVFGRTGQVSATALRLFHSIVVSDRSGKLTTFLVEKVKLLDFVVNTIKTHSDDSAINAAFMLLSTMYVWSRLTCALVSRHVPPPICALLFATKCVSSGDANAIASSLPACSTASYALYPGAHVLPVPYYDHENTSIAYAPTKAVIESTKPQEKDFQPSFIFPQQTSSLINKIEALDRSHIPKELPCEKSIYNLGEQQYGIAEDVIPLAISLSGRTFDNDYDVPILHPAIFKALRLTEVLRFGSRKQHVVMMEEVESQKHAELTWDATEYGSELYIDTPTQDSLEAQLIERFSAGGSNQWQLFITAAPTSAQSVLHRGVMNLEVVSDDERDTGMRIDATECYWTIHESESYESMVESGFTGSAGKGVYGSEESAAQEAKLYTPEQWKESHRMKVTFGEVDSITGDLAMVIVRKYDPNAQPLAPEGRPVPTSGRRKSTGVHEAWELRGKGFEFGFSGVIMLSQVVDGETVEALGGAFVLLKPGMASAALEGHSIDPFSQLAHLPVKLGPLADIEIENRASEHYDLDLSLLLSRLVTTFRSFASNHDSMLGIDFEALIGLNENQYADLVLGWTWYPDPDHEDPIGIWGPFRVSYALQVLKDMEAARLEIISWSRDERDADLRVFERFKLPSPVGPQGDLLLYCLNYKPNQVAKFSEKEMRRSGERNLWSGSEEDWNAILPLHFKWVTRLNLFEVIGMNIETAVAFTWSWLREDLGD